MWLEVEHDSIPALNKNQLFSSRIRSDSQVCCHMGFFAVDIKGGAIFARKFDGLDIVNCGYNNMGQG